MVKKLIKPEVNEEVVPFSEGGSSSSSTCSGYRVYADEEIDDITF